MKWRNRSTVEKYHELQDCQSEQKQKYITSLMSSANSLTVDIATVAASSKGYLQSFQKGKSKRSTGVTFSTNN